jgi:putative hydrolase of the HAD superfamily
MIQHISAIMVDLDDTLVAFDAVAEPSWRQVCAEHCSAHGGVDPARLYDAISIVSTHYWSDPERHRIGRADLTTARRSFVAEALQSLGLPTEMAAGLADRYSTVRTEAMYLLPGAMEALDTLRARGCALALVTNGDSAGQRAKVARFGLRPRFDAIVVEGEVGAGKPDPRIFQEALRRLGASPGDACMVGDNFVWDIEGPGALGIRGIWIDREGRGTPADARAAPWRTARRFAEVPGILFGG